MAFLGSWVSLASCALWQHLGFSGYQASAASISHFQGLSSKIRSFSKADPETSCRMVLHDFNMTFSGGKFCYYEARNDYTNSSETILLSNKCVCNRNINSQTINVCSWRVHRKCLMEAPKSQKKTIPARKPSVTDVLCNWGTNSQIIRMCV